MAHQQVEPYVWPRWLGRPEAGLRLVYLDLNHWISLAKAATGHKDGDRYREALKVVRAAATSGTTVFPLSSTHYMEMSNIKDPRQRADIAMVMEELSGFRTILSRTIIMRFELEEALQDYPQVRGPQMQRVPLLNFGVGPSLGIRGGLQIRSSDGTDVTATTRQKWPGGPSAFDAWKRDAELYAERAILRGPSDEEVPALKARGWDPTVARTTAEKRAEQERDQGRRLDADPRWRKGRLRDVVSARYLLIELRNALNESLGARGIQIEDAFPNRESARHFVAKMPSADVDVTLTTAAHRNRDKSWKVNDIFDIDALSIAAPYCDVVATERHASSVLNAAKIPGKAGTRIVPTLSDLVTILNETS
ncbi:hypothetical protein ACIPPS_01900 [Streptomyces sp. NPDC090127]|uniref:hypothetical protein n=1 Tax=Streptomyces sp. NPDC090127 TaxID=3365953 RepID=UPI0038276C66